MVSLGRGVCSTGIILGLCVLCLQRRWGICALMSHCVCVCVGVLKESESQTKVDYWMCLCVVSPFSCSLSLYVLL